MKTIKSIAGCMTLIFAPAAFAQIYIVPEGECGTVTLHTTHAGDFPNLGETIAANRVKDAYETNSPDGRHHDLQWPKTAMKSSESANSLDFTTNIVQDDGVVMAGVNLNPVVSGNETRTEHAKTVIFCGATAPIADWQRSAGLGLEIYPQGWNGRRPRLKAGDKMQFMARDQSTNKMLTDIPMDLYRAGAGLVATGVQDPNGIETFPYPEPGWYMVTTTYRRPDPQQPGHWLVDTSSLTFEVK